MSGCQTYAAKTPDSNMTIKTPVMNVYRPKVKRPTAPKKKTAKKSANRRFKEREYEEASIVG